MGVKINKRLNLVLPATVNERGRTVAAYVHSTPISKEVFDRYFEIIGLTQSRLLEGGVVHSIASAPRIACLTMRKIAEKQGEWDDAQEEGQKVVGVKNGLVAEITRLTNVLAPTERGWELVPLEQAVSQGYFSPEEADEVTNVVTFFTVASWMYPAETWEGMRDQTMATWGGQTTSSSATEYLASLPTSTETETSQPAPITSSLPV